MPLKCLYSRGFMNREENRTIKKDPRTCRRSKPFSHIRIFVIANITKISYQKNKVPIQNNLFVPLRCPASKPAAIITVFFPKKISATFSAADRISISESCLSVFPVACSRMVNSVWNLLCPAFCGRPPAASYISVVC